MSNGANISATVVLSTNTKLYEDTVFVAAWGPTNPPFEHKYEADQMALWGAQLPNGTGGGVWFPMNQWAIDPDYAVFLGAPPAVASWGPGRLDMFVAGQDGSLWHIWAGNADYPAPISWGVWEYLGYPAVPPPNDSTTIASTLAILAPAPNQIAVYVAGADGYLWWRQFNNGWAPWTYSTLVGTNQIQAGPAVAGFSLTNRHVFVLGTDQQLWWYGPNGVLETLGAPSPEVGINPAGAVTACTFGTQSVAVFVQGTDNALWCRMFMPVVQGGVIKNGLRVPPPNPGPSKWRGWQQLCGGSTITGQPSVTGGGPNALDVFCVNGDPEISQGQLLHAYFNIGDNAATDTFYTEVWSAAFEQFGPGLENVSTVAAPPCPVGWRGKNLEVLAVNPQQMVQRLEYNGHWGNWVDIPGAAIPIQA